MAQKKKITLHPMREDGTLDLSINLYPKTLLNGIVNDNGEEVEVALKSDIPSFNIENGTGLCSIKTKTIKEDEAPNIALGDESIAFNHRTVTYQKACAAFGGGTQAGDDKAQADSYGFCFSIGEMTAAQGRGSFATGNTTNALGMYSSSNGYKTKAVQDWQFVVGAMNSYSHTSEQESSMPLNNIQNALFIVGNGYEQYEADQRGDSELKTVGSDAFAVYKDGHAELAIQGSTDNSVVIKKSVTTDLVKGSGARSIIQIHGAQANVASGQSAIALGMGCQATATRSVAIGDNLISNKSNMTAVGKYNDSSIANTLFVVGNGSSTTRSNALSVFSDGHVEIGLMGSTDKAVATKEYVDTNKGTKLYSHHILLYATEDEDVRRSIYIIFTRSKGYPGEGTLFQDAGIVAYGIVQDDEGGVNRIGSIGFDGDALMIFIMDPTTPTLKKLTLQGYDTFYISTDTVTSL